MMWNATFQEPPRGFNWVKDSEDEEGVYWMCDVRDAEGKSFPPGCYKITDDWCNEQGCEWDVGFTGE